MVIKMNVPKLRFNEFNTEWNEIKLSDYCTIITKGTTPSKFYNSGIRFIKIESLNNHYIDNSKCLYIDDKTHFGNLKRSILFENDILFAIAGATVGKCGIVRKINLPANTNQALSIIRLKNSINPLFVLNCLDSYNMRKYIFLNVAIGAQPNLNLEQIANFRFKIPSKIEQDKIINLINLLDKKIELQLKKIEALKLYKKGLLLNYFKGKKTNKIIKDIIKYGKAGGTPKSSVKEYYNGKIPFLSISDMTKQGKYIYNTERNISEIGLKNSSAWLVPEDSIILSMYASYGLVAINKIKLSTSQAMFNMILNDNVFVEYIYQYLNYLNISNYYDKLISTGTQSNLSAEKIYNIKIFIPEFNEQKLIANLLNCIDILIEFNIKKKKNYHKLKKGLMQNMFV